MVVAAVVITALVIGMGVVLHRTFAPVRYARYLARWAYFTAGPYGIRPGRAARIVRVLTAGLMVVVAGALVLCLVLEAYPDPATVPDWYLVATLVWCGVAVLTAVLSIVVGLSGRPRALMISQLRGLSVDEADAWVQRTMKLPAEWAAHVDGEPAPRKGRRVRP
ncbi:hypothetical protein Cph01nite_36430 [Cellulomonas phragmiteti]|uniref:Uncharacterized protein n=2 Tax=Cellulomonas phragmiteti TaxID=478780 RepID=A0ABQ4DRA1_9CELL|nr:hypothetical protein Cph01nite_36430 [Cellulomonas phragmiteti]